MDRIKLTVNEEKTRICHVPAEQVEFLGYTIGRMYSAKDGHEYMGTRPSKQAVSKIKDTIHELTSPSWGFLEVEELINRVNRRLQGWWNYFRLDSIGRGHKTVDGYTRTRIRQWLKRKHRFSGKGVKRYSASRLHGEMGLIQLAWLPRNFS